MANKYYSLQGKLKKKTVNSITLRFTDVIYTALVVHHYFLSFRMGADIMPQH